MLFYTTTLRNIDSNISVCYNKNQFTMKINRIARFCCDLKIRFRMKPYNWIIISTLINIYVSMHQFDPWLIWLAPFHDSIVLKKFYKKSKKQFTVYCVEHQSTYLSKFHAKPTHSTHFCLLSFFYATFTKFKFVQMWDMYLICVNFDP